MVIFEWQVSLLFIVLNDKKLSSHMAQISEHINLSNRKINSYYQTRKMIVNLGSNKGKKNNNSSLQLTRLKTSLITSIVDIHENNLSNVDRKYDMRKVRTYSVNQSLTLFSCLMRAMYNIFNYAKKKSHVEFVPSRDQFIILFKEKLRQHLL